MRRFVEGEDRRQGVELMWLTGRLALHRYWDRASCKACPLKPRRTPGQERRIRRWEHEAVLEAMQARLDRKPDAMRIRRALVEHPFGTLEAWPPTSR
jgi:transposase